MISFIIALALSQKAPIGYLDILVKNNLIVERIDIYAIHIFVVIFSAVPLHKLASYLIGANKIDSDREVAEAKRKEKTSADNLIDFLGILPHERKDAFVLLALFGEFLLFVSPILYIVYSMDFSINTINWAIILVAIFTLKIPRRIVFIFILIFDAVIKKFKPVAVG